MILTLPEDRIQDSLKEWAPTLQGAPIYDFVKFSKKNCMKSRKFWTVGGPGGSPLRSVTGQRTK